MANPRVDHRPRARCRGDELCREKVFLEGTVSARKRLVAGSTVIVGEMLTEVRMIAVRAG